MKRNMAAGVAAISVALSVALAPSTLAKSKPELTEFALVMFPVDDAAAEDNYQQRYVQVDNAQCHSGLWPHWIGQQGWLYGNSSKPVKVAVEKRLYIQAVSTAANALRRYGCINVSSFVPELNHNYSVVHHIDKSDRSRLRCELVVKDLATGAPPDSLQEHPVEGMCTLP